MSKENLLQMSLTRQWFEMTKAGVKTEDYREINPYWALRFINRKSKGGIEVESIWYWHGFLSQKENNERVFKFRNQKVIDFVIKEFGFKPFTENIMTLGYPKATDSERILKIEHKGIEIRTGKPEWGAEPGKLYFVIMHGNILNG